MLKELVYLKGFAKGREMFETLKAIELANKLHSNQTRKSGKPYIVHPSRVAMELVALGLYNDNLIAASIMHDIVEDCGISEMKLINEHGFSKETIDLVSLVTKIKGVSTSQYYDEIRKNPFACLIKISDRCHNVSTMAGVFSKDKIVEYIKETEEYVIPLCKYCINYYPEYSDQVIVMRYHIESVCETLKAVLNILQ